MSISLPRASCICLLTYVPMFFRTLVSLLHGAKSTVFLSRSSIRRLCEPNSYGLWKSTRTGNSRSKRSLQHYRSNVLTQIARHPYFCSRSSGKHSCLMHSNSTEDFLCQIAFHRSIVRSAFERRLLFYMDTGPYAVGR